MYKWCTRGLVRKKENKSCSTSLQKHRKIDHIDTQDTHKQITRQRLELGLEYVPHMNATCRYDFCL